MCVPVRLPKLKLTLALGEITPPLHSQTSQRIEFPSSILSLKENWCLPHLPCRHKAGGNGMLGVAGPGKCWPAAVGMVGNGNGEGKAWAGQGSPCAAAREWQRRAAGQAK